MTQATKLRRMVQVGGAWLGMAFSLILAGTIGYSPAAAQASKCRLSYGDTGTLLSQSVKWRYHAGDNMAWADPDLDDASWPEVETTHLGDSLPGGWQGIGWFRLRVEVDSSLWNVPIALLLAQTGASEVYLNGRHVLSLGTVGRTQDAEVPFLNNPERPDLFTFDALREQVIAVRYSNFSQTLSTWGDLPNGFYVQLVGYEAADARYQQHIRLAVKHQMFFTGWAVAFSLLHLFMFLYYPRLKANLYFALFAAAIVGISFTPAQMNVTHDVSAFLALAFLMKISVLATALFGLWFLYTLFYERTPRQHWAFVSIGALLAAGAFFLERNIIYLYALIALGETSRVVAVAVARKKDGAWIIGLGYLVFVAACAYQILLDMDVVGFIMEEFYWAYLFGVLALLVSMSIHLARRFFQINANLNRQLVQVQELSAKTIDQERQAKEQEVARTLLEQEIEHKKQELEKARELEKAKQELESVNSIILRWDLRGRVIALNRFGQQLFGYSEDELVGRSVIDTIVPPTESSNRDLVAMIHDILRNPAKYAVNENENMRKDGERVWIAWRNTPITNSDGSLREILSVGIDITDRKLAEQALQKETDKAQRYLDVAGTIIVAIDARERVTLINKKGAEVLGGSESDIIGKNWFDNFVPKHLRDGVRKAFQMLMRGELAAVEYFENHVVTWQGEKRLIAWYNTLLKDDAGEIIGTLSSGIDITERERAEKALRESEQRYRSVFVNSTIGIFRTTPDGRVLAVNPATAAIMGYDSPQEVVETVSDLASQVYQDPTERQQVLQLLRERGQAVADVNLRRKDETPVIARLNIWTVKDDNGELHYLEGLLEDITEKKRIEEQLKLYHRIFQAASDSIMVIDLDGNIVECNPARLKASGQTADELVGRSALATGTDEDGGRIGEIVRQQGRYRGEIRFMDKQGSATYIDLSIFSITDDSGQTLCYVGLGRDTTERKQHEEVLRLANTKLQEANEELKRAQVQLVQSEKMASLGMLVAGVAHEINTPVGAIASMHNTLVRAVDRLKSSAAHDPSHRCATRQVLLDHENIMDEANKVIRSGTERVTTIVRRLRSFARLDEAEMKRMNINDGLEDTLTLIHHEIKHHIEVIRDYGEIPEIACYPGQLNQVFLNILINARQAIKGTGWIKVSTRQQDDMVVAEISDNGHGIPEASQARIFDPGFTTKGVGVGTGLGLSICYQIIQSHRGEITVTSKPGQGSTFTIRLPMNLDAIPDNT